MNIKSLAENKPDIIFNDKNNPFLLFFHEGGQGFSIITNKLQSDNESKCLNKLKNYQNSEHFNKIPNYKNYTQEEFLSDLKEILELSNSIR